jgi:hypothetical protein
MKKRLATRLTLLFLFSVFVVSFSVRSTSPLSQRDLVSSKPGNAITTGQTFYYCGDPKFDAKTSIDLGCEQHGNPIEALIFAIIKLLSDGAGLVVIGSIIVAGIQFSSSRDEPQAKAAATKRIEHAVIALFVYFFAYAILNYLVPNQILK